MLLGVVLERKVSSGEVKKAKCLSLEKAREENGTADCYNYRGKARTSNETGERRSL